jgi:polysaccharide export outer membrane protein
MIRVSTIFIGAFLLLVQGSAFCETAEKTGEEAKPAGEGSSAPLPADLYKVSAQDVLHVQVVNEVDLTGDFVVSKDGTIKYPYLEYLSVADKTVKEIESLITRLLKPDWLVDPQVIVMVRQYSAKLAYVTGEGMVGSRQISFSGQNEMTLLRAIAMAGGFSRIAKKSKVFLFTTDDKGKPKRLEVDAKDIIKGKTLDPPIKANDTIYVGERFW